MLDSITIPTNSEQKLSGLQKIAVLLMTVDKASADRIISFFDDEELQKISEAMISLGYITPETVERIIIEFMQDVRNFSGIVGNAKIAIKMLTNSVGEERASAIINSAKRTNNNNVWDRLNEMDIYDIIGIIKKEHPQAVAAILYNLQPTKASEVLTNLNKDYAIEIVKRMLTLQKMQNDKLERLENALSDEITNKKYNRSQAGDSDYANFRSLADIFDNISVSDSEEIIAELTEYDAAAMSTVRQFMFSFNDLIKLNHSSLQTLITNVDKNTLSVALKGVEKDMLELFLDRISQRAARLLVESISRIKATPTEIKIAQSSIAKTAKNMIAKGMIRVASPEDI